MTQWSVLVPGAWELAERPVWDGQRLLWVDVFGGAVWRRDAGGELLSVEVGAPAGFLALRAGGGAIVGAGSQLVFLDAGLVPDRDPVPIPLPTGVRINDGACDPSGRLWFGGACTDGSHGRAPLFCYDARTGSLVQAREDVTESNGLGWSADGGTMYYVDSAEPVIQAFDYDVESGRPSRRRDLARIERGSPDGLVVDSEGALWLALWEGGAVRRYSPTGELLQELETPVTNPTCPALGGPCNRTLALATGWEGQSAEQRAREPWSGHLLAAQVDSDGVTPHRLAG